MTQQSSSAATSRHPATSPDLRPGSPPRPPSFAFSATPRHDISPASCFACTAPFQLPCPVFDASLTIHSIHHRIFLCPTCAEFLQDFTTALRLLNFPDRGFLAPLHLDVY